MRKHLITLAALLLTAAVLVACGYNAKTTGYVEPAMEGAASVYDTESTTEPASQTTESEPEAQTEVEILSSEGTTAQAVATSNPSSQPTSTSTTSTTTSTKPTSTATRATTTTTRAATTTTTTTTQTTTTTKATTTTTRTTTTTATTSTYEVMDAAYLGTVIRALNNIRAGLGLEPMREDPALMASSLEQAWKMARAGNCFHSESPPGCESVAYYPVRFFSAEAVGEGLTYHVSDFRQAEKTRVGVAVVRRDDYLYCVMQGTSG